MGDFKSSVRNLFAIAHGLYTGIRQPSGETSIQRPLNQDLEEMAEKLRDLEEPVPEIEQNLQLVEDNRKTLRSSLLDQKSQLQKESHILKETIDQNGD